MTGAARARGLPDGWAVLSDGRSGSGLTLIARLAHAPFPFEDRPESGRDRFFDGRDAETGARFHTGPDGRPLIEARHFQDDRVLFHVPPRFEAERPAALLAFFHGHRSEIRRTLIDELEITRQIDESGRNVVLVAPQLALEAADSHPGKLIEPGGLARFLEEAGTVVERALGREDGGGWAGRLPVILAAYSGGYRTLAYGLERGGVGERIAGVILLDALYDHVEKFADWIVSSRRRGFLLALYGQSTEEGMAALREQLTARGVDLSTVYPERLEAGAVNLVRVATAHEAIPLSGPPNRPLADMLRRLHGPVFERSA